MTSTYAKEENKNPSVTEFFKQHIYFSRFPEDDRIYLANRCAVKKLKQDELIFRDNEVGTSGYILKDGGVKIFKEGFLGEEQISQLGKGDIFGEMVLLDALPRSASSKSITETELVEISSEMFENLKIERPDIAVKIMEIFLKLLTTRLRTTTLKLFGQF